MNEKRTAHTSAASSTAVDGSIRKNGTHSGLIIIGGMNQSDQAARLNNLVEDGGVMNHRQKVFRASPGFAMSIIIRR